jgi:hypothetical protein
MFKSECSACSVVKAGSVSVEIWSAAAIVMLPFLVPQGGKSHVHGA